MKLDNTIKSVIGLFFFAVVGLSDDVPISESKEFSLLMGSNELIVLEEFSGGVPVIPRKEEKPRLGWLSVFIKRKTIQLKKPLGQYISLENANESKDLDVPISPKYRHFGVEIGNKLGLLILREDGQLFFRMLESFPLTGSLGGKIDCFGVPTDGDALLFDGTALLEIEKNNSNH